MRRNRKQLAHYWPTAHRTYFKRHTPTAPVTEVREDFNRIFTGMSPRDARRGKVNLREGVWTPPLDRLQTEEAYFYHVDLPGVARKDVDLRVEDDRLVVSGRRRPDFEKESTVVGHRERMRGRFYRAIRLPEGVDVDGVEATVEDGVLVVRLPKTEEAPRSTRIPIE